jgi:hypothetical protein
LKTEQVDGPTDYTECGSACNPELQLKVEGKTITIPLETLVNAAALRSYFCEMSFFGAIPEAEVEWGRLIDELGYAQLLAAKHVLLDMGILTQAYQIGSPGGIGFHDRFDLDRMVKDLMDKLP